MNQVDGRVPQMDRFDLHIMLSFYALCPNSA